jgi:hypothetical protein
METNDPVVSSSRSSKLTVESFVEIRGNSCVRLWCDVPTASTRHLKASANKRMFCSMSLVSFRAFLLPMIGVCSALGCHKSLLTSPGLRIRTDSLSYHLGTAAGPRVKVFIDNASSRSVLLAVCGGVVLPRMEQTTDSGWTDASLASCGPNPLGAVALAPSSTIEAYVNPLALGTYRLRAPVFDKTRQRFSRETSAVFKVH